MSADELAYLTPEARARVVIDRMLDAAGWAVQDAARVNLTASRGVAVREFVLKPPHGRADYLLFLDGRAVGVVEAKKEGETLTGVEWQSAKYVDGLPDGMEPAIEGGLAVRVRVDGDGDTVHERARPRPRQPSSLLLPPARDDGRLARRGAPPPDRSDVAPPAAHAAAPRANRALASENAWTRELWVYDLRTNMHFTLKQNPLRTEHLADFVSSFSAGDRRARAESERFRRFAYDELVARDKASLDITWLRDESLEDTDNLPRRR